MIRAFTDIPRWQRVAMMLAVTPAAVVVVSLLGGHPLIPTAMAALVGLGLVLAGVEYLRRHGKTDEALWPVLRWFVDYRRPTRRDVRITAGVVALSLLSNAVVDYAASALLQPARAGHGGAGGATEAGPVVLVAFAAFAIVVGPIMEELVFRNGMQKMAVEWVRPWVAIVGVSVVFAVFHVPSYGGLDQPAALLVPPLVAVWSSSVLYGWAYYRTGNIAVAMAAHGAHNALALASLL